MRPAVTPQSLDHLREFNELMLAALATDTWLSRPRDAPVMHAEFDKLCAELTGRALAAGAALQLPNSNPGAPAPSPAVSDPPTPRRPGEPLPIAAAITGGTAPSGTLADARREFEREWLTKRLAENNDNISATARAIGLERASLYRKVCGLGIAPAPRTRHQRKGRP
jgi:transcriptional regulator with GAF, ATPase, and Fis domain